MSLAKNWSFTQNNYTSESVENAKSFITTYCRYGIFQKEVGESGTPHLQGYIQLTDKKRLEWITKRFPSTHFEVSRGSLSQNITYCSKEGGSDAFTFGVGLEQGARSDLADVSSRILQGEPIIDIIRSQPEIYVRYARGLEQLSFRTAARRDYKTRVLWFYGSTGTGKSYTANQLAPSAYWKEGTTKWWDGYDGVSDVIIDDYRRDLCTFAQLLRLFDRYPLHVESKGGSIQFAARLIIISTPKSPKDTWEGRTEEDLAQLLRRIDEVRHFNDLFNPKFIKSD